MAERSSKQKEPSRRRFIGASAGAALAVGAGPAAVVLSGQNPGAAVGEDTTLALVNGRILDVGGPAPAAGAGVRVIDLRGRTVTPGLVEPHIHSVSLADRPGYHTILENTGSIREIQEALAARRKEVPEGG